MRADILDSEVRRSGMTVIELCEKTGIPTSTYYRKRSGQVAFDTSDIKSICKVLNIRDAKQIKHIFLD